jgi:hypothetical protein
MKTLRVAGFRNISVRRRADTRRHRPHSKYRKCGVRRTIKAERRRQIQNNLPAENGRLLRFGELERRGVLFYRGKKARIKTTPSVAVHCWVRNPMGLLSGRLGLKKLAFLQERDDWLSAASAK